MLEIVVNGTPIQSLASDVDSFEALLALIREEIAPDEVVSSAWLNGAPLSDTELSLNPNAQGGTLSINTRSRRSYVQERLGVADRYMGQIVDSFSQSIHAFKTGHSGYGNTFLARGVDELLSFVAWYSTILDLEPAEQTGVDVTAFYAVVSKIQSACERLVAAQLLESTFTVSIELEKQLFPLLQRLRAVCSIAAPTHAASGEAGVES